MPTPSRRRLRKIRLKGQTPFPGSPGGRITLSLEEPDSYGDKIYAQRFTVSGPLQLRQARFMVYDADDGHFGDNDIYVTFFTDNGSGLPGTNLGQITVPAGAYPAYPSYTIVDIGSPDLVVNGEVHVAFYTNGIPPDTRIVSRRTEATGSAALRSLVQDRGLPC